MDWRRPTLIGESALRSPAIRMLILSVNTLVGTPRVMLYVTSAHPVASQDDTRVNHHTDLWWLSLLSLSSSLSSFMLNSLYFFMDF